MTTTTIWSLFGKGLASVVSVQPRSALSMAAIALETTAGMLCDEEG